MTELPKKWSYSAYSKHATCPRAYMHAYVERLPQPQHPKAERGIRIHKEAELYIIGEAALPPAEMQYFRDDLDALRQQGAAAEYEITLTRAWGPADDATRWLKCVIDAVTVYDDGSARVIDFKTGRPYPEHAAQMQLYPLALRSEIPEIGNITTELWYVDEKTKSVDVSVPQADDRLRKIWTARADKMLNDTEFRKTPGRHCNWCGFYVIKGGPCTG